MSLGRADMTPFETTDRYECKIDEWAQVGQSARKAAPQYPSVAPPVHVSG